MGGMCGVEGRELGSVVVCVSMITVVSGFLEISLQSSM